uniref:Ig-like domain-containing protein n=1 Tax=Oncorhynchus kisutch TaxID=8019 RepID=A0A8C7GM08_ONCKI
LAWSPRSREIISGSWAQYVLTQSAAQSVQPGQIVSIDCSTSSKYHQTSGEAPKLLIYYTSDRFTGVSTRFSGSGRGNGVDFTLTISDVQAEYTGVYYCQSYHRCQEEWDKIDPSYCGKLVVGYQREYSDVRPTMTVLPPSSVELQQGKATLMCLANKVFPSDWKLSWKVDGSSSSTWEVTGSPGVLVKDGHYSWSSTLTLPVDQWRKVDSVTCEATQGSQTPLSETLRRDQCSD